MGFNDYLQKTRPKKEIEVQNKNEEQEQQQQQLIREQEESFVFDEEYQKKSRLGKSATKGEESAGYVAHQLQTNLAQSTFEERTKYYFKDDKVMVDKMRRYYGLAAAENDELDFHAAIYTNTNAKKRRDKAHKAGDYFNEARKKELALNKLEEKGGLSNLKLYWKRDEIMRLRMEGMINAAKVKANSDKNEKYRIAKAKLSCFSVLLDQAKNLQDKASMKDFIAIQRNLSKEIANAQKDLEKYADNTEEKWKRSLGLIDTDILEKEKEKSDNPYITQEGVELRNMMFSLSQEYRRPEYLKAAGKSKEVFGKEMNKRMDPLVSMIHYVKRDQYGNPIDKLDVKKQEWNKKWIDAFSDKNAGFERKMLIKEALDDVKRFQLPSPEELEKNGPLYYLKKDPALYYEMTRKAIGFDNLKDFEPFVDDYIKMDPVLSAKIDALVKFSALLGFDFMYKHQINKGFAGMVYFFQEGGYTKEEMKQQKRDNKIPEDGAKAGYKEAYDRMMKGDKPATWEEAKNEAEKVKNTKFNKESYEIYKKYHKAGRMYDCPLYKGLYQPILEKKNGQMDLLRLCGAALRQVHFDDNWEPLTNKDREAHEWNLEYLKHSLNFYLDGEKKKESGEEMAKMVKEQYRIIFDGSAPLPSPDQLRKDIVEPLRENKPINCNALNALLMDADRYQELMAKGLTWGDVYKELPMGDFFEENPEIAACAEMYGEFNATVAVMYGQTKYGMLFDTGTRRISTATNKMSSFDKADFAEDMIRVYEAKYIEYHNLLKERK